jgi:hypothetical protein
VHPVKISHQSLQAVGSFIKQLHRQIVENIRDFGWSGCFGIADLHLLN